MGADRYFRGQRFRRGGARLAYGLYRNRLERGRSGRPYRQNDGETENASGLPRTQGIYASGDKALRQPRSGRLPEWLFQHDCGKYVDFRNVAKCSYEIILFTEIIGISREERTLIANVVGCQSLPFQEIHRLSETVDRKSYLLIEKLATIFRVANSLDTSHKQKITKFSTDIRDDKLRIHVTTSSDFTFEKGIFAMQKFGAVTGLGLFSSVR